MSEQSNIRKTTYRLYPTPKQVAALNDLLKSHQQLYNAALEERISAWSKVKKSISYADQCKSLTALRRELPEWSSAANCSSQQMTLRRLDKAFSAFFKRVKSGQTPGFPRFKSLARFPGFSFKSHGDGWKFTPAENWKNGTLRLSGVGQIRTKGKSRNVGEIKSSDIFFRNGQWYLSLTISAENIDRKADGAGALAFDLGLETFAACVTHSGESFNIENPRWWRSNKDKIIDLQRMVSSKTNRRSNRRKNAVKRLAAAKSKLARQRLDWIHKTTAKLAGDYALVATEELSIKNMTRNNSGTVDEPGKMVAQKSGRNREILDTAPGLFTSLFRYKVQETGGEWVDAPTRKLKPSQRCPKCWSVEKKQLSDRVHDCKVCGHKENRDTASAQVVLRWALESFQGQELANTGINSSCETPSFA